MRLAEREFEISALLELLSSTFDGRGGLVVVNGPSGCGKSALVRDAARRGGELGMTVLRVVDSRLDGSAGVDVVCAVLGLLRQEGSEPVYSTMSELAELLNGFARTKPLLITVDDAHRADIDSLTLIAELATNLDRTPIAVVITGCPQPLSPQHDQLRREIVRRSGGQPLTVARLSRTGVGGVVRDRLPGTASADIASDIFAVTGGNPTLVTAAVEDTVAGAEAVPVTARYGPAFTRGVVTLLRGPRRSQRREVVEAIAALGRSAGLDLVVRLVDVDRRILRGIIAELTSIGLTAPGGVQPARLRAVVLGVMAPEPLTHLRSRAAQVLYEDGAPADDIAHHLLAMGTAPQPWAISVLREAAELAVRGNRYRHAMSLLKLAARSCADRQTQVEIKARLLDVTWWVDPNLVSGRSASLMSDAREGCLSPRWLATLARRIAWQGDADDAADVLGLSCGADDPEHETVVEQTISRFWIGHVFPGLLGGNDGVVPAIPALPPEFTVGGFPWLHSASELPRLLVLGRQETIALRAGEILQRVRPDQADLEPLQVALFSALAVERFDPEQPWFARMSASIDDLVPLHWRATLSAATAVSRLWLGDVGRAEKSAARALELFDSGQWGVLAGLPLGTRLLAMTEQGRHQEVANELARPMPQAFSRSPYGLVYLRARGRHHLALGSPHAALTDFRGCGEILRTWGLELPGLVPWRVDAAEALLGIGDEDAAVAALDEQLRLVPSPYSRVRGIALRLRALTLPVGRVTATLRESATVLERCGDRLELARTLGALARTYRESGNRAYARKASRRAEKLARNAGGEWAMTQLSNGSGSGAAPKREVSAPTEWSLAVLTAAETKVSRLVVQGYTNREIADTLYVTTSTVEQHLTRIYRKLNIRRRDQLGAQLTSL